VGGEVEKQQSPEQDEGHDAMFVGDLGINWLQSLAGALTGFLVGLCGVGGGALMTPLLLLGFGVAPLSAVGTDLWMAAITKLVATRIHHGRGLVDWPVVRRLWIGSLSASALTLFWMRLHPVDQTSIVLMKTAIAGAVLLTAAGMAFQAPLHALGRHLRLSDTARFKALQGPLTILAGALLGALVTLSSVGAGALGTVFLVYLYPLRLTPPRLIATDIAHAIPLALFAGMGHLLIGNVDLRLLGTLLLGSIPGVIGGSLLSARMPPALLRAVLAVVLALVGWTLWRSVRP
jgi:hypothetical protein